MLLAVPSPAVVAAFAAVSFVLIVVPGPSVLFVVSRGVALGRRAAIVTAVGNAAGAYLLVLLVAVGLGAAVERSAALFTVLKLAGAAYICWLGVQAFRHRRDLAVVVEVATSARRARTVFAEGFVVGVTNPKIIVFFAAILPQYVDPGGAPAGLQMAALGLVFVAVAVACDSAWGMAAGSARAWLSGSPQRLERLGGLGGLVMVVLGVRLALTGRHD